MEDTLGSIIVNNTYTIPETLKLLGDRLKTKQLDDVKEGIPSILGMPPLHLVFWARKFNLKTLNLLFEQTNFDIDVKDTDGSTALITATNFPKPNTPMCDLVFDKLLKKGADVNIQNNNGLTALMAAAKNGHVDYIKKLIDAGADLEKRDDNGWTATELASHFKHTEADELLKEEERKMRPLFEKRQQTAMGIDVSDAQRWVLEPTQSTSVNPTPDLPREGRYEVYEGEDVTLTEDENMGFEAAELLVKDKYAMGDKYATEAWEVERRGEMPEPEWFTQKDDAATANRAAAQKYGDEKEHPTKTWRLDRWNETGLGGGGRRRRKSKKRKSKKRKYTQKRKSTKKRKSKTRRRRR